MLLDILEYPDPRLRKIAAPITAVTAEIQELARDMAETMYAAPGVGLAATQVNVHKRLFVIYISDNKNDLRVFINPQIIDAEGDAECEEGCLSVRWLYGKVNRSTRVSLKALNERGEKIQRGASGLLAQIFQHETDHLDGTLFTDLARELWEMGPEEIAELQKE